MIIKYIYKLNIIKLASCASIFLTPFVYANEALENTNDQSASVQKLETLTVSASRADVVQENSKQVTKLDEKEIQLLRNGSSGSIATVLAKLPY